MIKTKSVALNVKLGTWVVVALNVLIGCFASVETVGQGVDEILVHRGGCKLFCVNGHREPNGISSAEEKNGH